MIAGYFHQGSGLGNQLFRYVATRTIAEDKGYEWGMLNPENFKGHFFKDFDFGKEVPQNGMFDAFNEERVNHPNGTDIRGYDEKIKFIHDNTIIDGEFQGQKYFEHRMDDIDKWIRVDPVSFPSNTCVISFRGGEYVGVPSLFLTKAYWDNAIENMRKIKPDLAFRVITDDMETAKRFFPTIPVTHEIGNDWRAIRYAPYLILSNSSFAIFPTLLNKNATIIAPKYWARHNTSDGYWALEQNKYKGWYYQDREGKLEIYS